MKKILYSIFLLLAISGTFVSCGDDDPADAPAPAGNPAEAAAAKYTGNWTVISSGDTVVVPGTIEIAATDSAYTANFTFTSEQFSINVGGKDQTTKLNATSVANIAFAGASGKSFDYSNSSNTNPMGTSFAGKIFEGNITSLFTLQQKVGRKKYEFSYRFVGQRQ